MQARRCADAAKELGQDLVDGGVQETFLNVGVTTVFFPVPSKEICEKYCLACDLRGAHFIVTMTVTDELIEEFKKDYLEWYKRRSR